jgi:two-component system heavy metal sensor histidine kinase CusS
MFSKMNGKPGTAARGASLAFRLTAWYSTASFLLVASATGLLYFGLSGNLKRLSEQLLADELDVCRALVDGRGGDLHALREEAEIDSAIRKYEKFYVRVIGPDQQVLAVTPGMDQELSSSQITSQFAGRSGVIWMQSPSGRPYRVVIATLAAQAGSRLHLQVAVDLTQELEVLARHRVWVYTVLAAGLLFCPWVGFVIARRGTRPLREMAETARHVHSATLNERICIEGYPSEVADLADTFNEMLERLEDSFTRLSRFSADIAHELRTPVNNIRGESEVALARARSPEEYRDVLGSCLEEAVRLTDLIESLLFLARVESPGDHLKRHSEDLGGLLTDVRDYYEAAAAEAGVTLLVEGGAGVVAAVDRTLLQRAIGNLVSNALANTPAGGAIRLSARRCPEGVRMEVSDTGVGIPVEVQPRVFDRFYRADPARSRNSGGTGLGLAIVHQIVSLHGGNVRLNSEAGRGATVSVTLPQAAAEAAHE